MISKNILYYVLGHKPIAYAEIHGGDTYPEIEGLVQIFNICDSLILQTEIYNLPNTASNFFGYHIHEGSNCNDNFTNTGEHFNPANLPHPQHLGDLPPLISYNGLAWNMTLIEKFTIEDIIGRTLVIHQNPDDFTSQPAGNAGIKIACGIITPNRW